MQQQSQQRHEEHQIHFTSAAVHCPQLPTPEGIVSLVAQPASQLKAGRLPGSPCLSKTAPLQAGAAVAALPAPAEADTGQCTCKVGYRGMEPCLPDALHAGKGRQMTNAKQ